MSGKRISRAITLILSFAMLLQSGFVVPVFAEMTYSGYRFEYREAMYTGSQVLTPDEEAEEIDKGITITKEVIHPILVDPNDSLEADGNGYASDRTETVDRLSNTSEKIDPSVWTSIPKPRRIVGYTFDGWYRTEVRNTGQGIAYTYTDEHITSDSVIEDSFLDNAGGYLPLYGKWTEYTSPTITSDSLNILKKNSYGEDIEDAIVWTDKEGTTIPSFDSEITDYYANVYGTMDSIKLSFEQYEPKAESEVTFNGESLTEGNGDLVITDITAEEQGLEAYKINRDGKYERFYDGTKNGEDVCITGKTIQTSDYLTLKFVDEAGLEDGYNIFKVVVTLPESEDNQAAPERRTRTYTFHIRRLNRQLELVRGNVPYGFLISSLARESFNQTFSSSNTNYNPKAWNIYYPNGNEVLKGSELNSDTYDYINYDKDETALVVYEGEDFIDPGVELSDRGIGYAPGATTPPDDSGNYETIEIKRTITASVVDSLKFNDWRNKGTETEVNSVTLNGAEDENVIGILNHKEYDASQGKFVLKSDHKYIKPGIYDMTYTYDNGTDLPITAVRKLIVLPKATDSERNDLNMDGYVNALDTLVYEDSIAAESDTGFTDSSEWLYRYRALDVTTPDDDGKSDGTITDEDKSYFRSRGVIYRLYDPRNSVDKSISLPYTPPASASDDKVQLYMELLGVSSNSTDLTDEVSSISASDIPEQDTELDAGDTFVTGYRFANTASFGAADGDNLKALSFAITYDTRYVQPLAANAETLRSQIYTYNPNLSVFDIECRLNEKYQTPDNSTAKVSWQSETQLRTMRIELYLKENETFGLSDGYILKLPFRVLHVTPSQRTVMATMLGAETLTMAVGDTGYMWDTGDALNSVTENLMGYGADGPLEYMGDYTPVFKADTSEATVLDDATYGVEYSYRTGKINKQLDLNLPNGLTYIPSTGLITGTPAEVYGDEEPVIFYIDGQKYSITVKKAPMRVRLKSVGEDDEKKNVVIERTYGDMPNPDLKVLTPNQTGYDDTYFEYAEEDIKFPKDVTINGYSKTADTIDGIVKTAPTFSCDAGQYSDATDAYPIVFDDKDNDGNTILNGLADNYYFVCEDEVTMTINPRPITVTDADVISTSINASFPGEILGIQAVNEGKTKTGITHTFKVQSGDILENDTVIIEYAVAYNQTETEARALIDAAKAADPDNPNIVVPADASITKITILEDERGGNYVLRDGVNTIANPTQKGGIADTQIVSFAIVSSSELDFEYGERIDLNRARVRLTYDDDNSEPQTMTFAAALKAGLKMEYIRYGRSGRDVSKIADVSLDENGLENNAYDAVYSNDGKTKITDDDPIYIRITNNSEKAALPKVRDTEVKIRRKQIRIKANDKIRVYGDGVLGMYTDTDADSHQMYRTNGATLGEAVSGNGYEKGFTYSLLNDMATDAPFSDPVTDITEHFTPVFACPDADNAALDIDADKTSITRDIEFEITDNTCLNYELIPEDGTLTINQRPITITAITGNVPRLTSKDYTELAEGATTGTIKAPNYVKEDISAYAGSLPEGQSAASMTVETEGQSGAGLFTNDSGVTDNIKLIYDAVYTDSAADLAYAALKNGTTTKNVTISTDNLVLPDDYGKNHNYVLKTSDPKGPGVMHARYIKSIEVTNDLKTTYTYGEKLDYTKSEDSDDSNNIHIEYDSGESEDITFKQAADNTSVRTDFVLVKDDGAASGLPVDGTQLIYENTSNRSNLRYVGPYDSENPVSFKDASKDSDGHFTYSVEPLVVNKHKLTLRTNVVYTTYGDDSPYKDGTGKYTFTYDLDDPEGELQFGDQTAVTKRTGLTVDDNIPIAGFVKPTIECYEDDGETHVNKQTDVGLYTIRISGAAADNYDIEYKTEDLVVRPRALVVDKITGIPNLSAKDAAEGKNLAKDLEITVAYDDTAGDFVATGKQVNAQNAKTSGVELTFASDSGLLFPKDSITITCTANYPAGVRDPDDPDRKVDLTITNPAIKGSSRNYYLRTIISPQLKAGVIEERKIQSITIPYSSVNAYDPSRNSDGSQKIYTYGEPYDWDSFRANVTYDNGDTYEMLTYDELKEHDINLYKIVRVDEQTNQYVLITETEKESMDFLTFDDHEGMSLVFYAQVDENTRRFLPITFPVQIRKRPMRVKADYMSYVYGETPPSPSITYNTDDFAVKDGIRETADDIILTAPHSYTYTTNHNEPLPDDGLPHPKTQVDDYVVIPHGAETQNYFFIYNGTDAQTYHDEYDTSYTPDTSYLGANTLKVLKRPLDITRVISGIPELDAEKAVIVTRTGHYTFSDLTGIATRKDDGDYTDDTTLDTDGLMEGDTVTVVFDADYQSNTPNTTPEVEIENFRLASVHDDDGNEIHNDNANYDLRLWPSANGEVIQKRISKLEFKRMPDKLKYTYGEWFNIADGLIYIYYNDNLPPTEIHFRDAARYGLTLEFVQKQDDGSYTSVGVVRNNTLLTVKDHNNAYFRITPPQEDADITDAKAVVSAEKEKLTVEPKLMRVTALDATMPYNGELPSFSFAYNLSDLVNGDTLESDHFTYGQVDPSSYEITNHGTTEEPEKLRAGAYDIHPIGAENVNYVIEPVAGTLTVEPIPVKISAIAASADTVPELTSEMIYINGTLPIKIPAAASFDALTFDASASPVAGDEFGVKYNVVYNADNADGSISTGGDHDVGVADLVIDSTFPDSVNYTIAGYPGEIEKAGVVASEEITGVDIVTDPTLRDDNINPISYTHGDTLNLARGSVTVTYDSGRVVTGIRFDELDEKTNSKIKAVFVDKEGNETNIPAENGAVLSHAVHDGASIKLITESKKTVTEGKVITEKLVVNKAVVTVKADDKSRYYGDENPELTLQYVSGFVDSDGDGTPDTLEEFMNGMKYEPGISCSAERHSPVGEYDIVLAGDGVHDNYSFELINAKLTVNKRPLDIIDITSGIPVLTSKQIYEEPQSVHSLDGAATNTAGQLILGNLFQGDAIRITYTAIYTGTAPEENVKVSLSDIAIDTEFGDGGNYVLRDKPLTVSGGTVNEKQLSSIEIVSQPKLDYVYGETLDLSEPGIRLIYDDGSMVTGVKYEELGNYGVNLTITDANGMETMARPGDKLTVRQHTGAYLTMYYPDTDSAGARTFNPTTKAITVEKKQMNVNIHDYSSIYGDEISTDMFSFDYERDDFEYNETYRSNIFTNHLKAPEFVCTDREGKTVSKTSVVGTYAIRMENGESDNYRFVYNNGTLAITKRPLTITDIAKEAIPELTSDIIFENQGDLPHRLTSSAVKSQLEYENLVNDDDIGVTFTAIYQSETPNEAYEVGIEDLTMDDTVGRSVNYYINTADSLKSRPAGGVIHDKEITEIEITEQPELKFTYGDKLSFAETGGMVHITYDSGFEEDVPFSELADHRITLAYTGDNELAGQPASEGDVLTLPAHNGKRLTLRAKSTHTVTPRATKPIEIEKLVLEYGTCIADPIVYDGFTTSTTGTVIFTNPQNGDKVTATADFTFEDKNAGTDKTVYITNIKLDNPFGDNYELPSEETTTTGAIMKADAVPELSSGAIELSDETNAITITPPQMTQVQTDGGAKYEYSVDGGEMWQESNVFENLSLGQDCEICIRFAGTDNYNQSDATEPISVKTYKVKLTLIVRDEPEEGEDYRVLRSFYTNTESVEDEEGLRALIGEITETDEAGETVEVNYYTLTSDLEGTTALEYPLELVGDMTVYATLTAPRRRGSGSGGGGNSGGTSFVIRYENEDGTAGSAVPSTIEVTTGIKTISLIGDTESTSDIIWSSDNESVATVDNGIVTIHNSGRAVISAYVKGQRALSDTVTLIVTEGNDTAASPSPAPSTPTLKPDKNMNIPYLSGFENMIKPDDYMTRAEAATIMVKLAGDTGEEYENIFPDVREGTWYIDIIAQAAARGLISGFEDGNFYPEDTVTREQFAAMIVRLVGLESVEGQTFDDVEEWRWSAGSINAAVEEGIIAGYSYGTFLPENPIRRSEAVRMANVATRRIPDKAVIDEIPCPYIDLPKDHWAYYEFMIASVEFEIK